MALTHGGQLNQISMHYDIELDLSTGISPTSYPIPQIPAAIWQRLPQSCPQLIAAAKEYYQAQHLLACSGSQAVIQYLPQLFAKQVADKATVWLPLVGYKEHEQAWTEAGYQINRYQELPKHLEPNSVVVVINPNNPSGRLYSKTQLTQLLAKLEQANGWLIVDEAFMDVVEPNQSMINLTDNRHLFVLRSIGKFFGLAGIRLGFVSSHPNWLALMADHLGPWQVNGPAQYIGQKALSDSHWQQNQRQQLKGFSDKLATLLSVHFNTQVAGTTLFKTIKIDNAPERFEQLCQLGIYVRLCDEQDALRFGIPDEQGLAVLTKKLKELPPN